MKFRTNWKSIVLAALTSSLAITSFSHAKEEKGGHGGGNGGGLVKRNGQYLTFNAVNAKVNIPLELLENDELPEVIEYADRLERIELPKDIRFELVQAVHPGPSRKYYRAHLSAMNAAQVKKIMASYSNTVQTKDGKIVLAAITNDAETYLFEPFFALKSLNSRLAILAHESYWSMNPNATYADVVRAEIEFESCLNQVNRSPSKSVVCSSWTKLLPAVLGDNAAHRLLPMRIAYHEDLVTGRLQGIADTDGRIPLAFLVSPEIIDRSREKTKMMYWRSADPVDGQDNFAFLNSQRKAHPNLKFLSFFQNWFQAGKVNFTLYEECDLYAGVNFAENPTYSSQERAYVWESTKRASRVTPNYELAIEAY